MKFDPTNPAAFTPRLNEEFHIARPDGGAWILTLETVDVSIDDEVQLCFSLLFRCAETDLPPGCHPLSHAQLGTCELGFNPVRVRRGALRYEAVVNLLRDSADLLSPGSTAGTTNP